MENDERKKLKKYHVSYSTIMMITAMGKVGLVASSSSLTDKNNTTRQLCRRHLFSSSSMSWWPDLLMSLSTIAMISLMLKLKVIRQVLRELPIEDIYVRAEWKISKYKIAISTSRLLTRSQSWFQNSFWNHDWAIFLLQN